MTPLELRLEALRLANVSAGSHEAIAATVDRARAYFDFLSVDQTPREKIDAALEAAGVR